MTYLSRDELANELGPAPKFGVEIDPSLFGLPSFSGSVTKAPRISREIALQVPAVKKAHDLVPGVLGTLPVGLIGPDFRPVNSELFSQPEPDVPKSVTWARLYADLWFEKVAWWKVLEVGWHGYPTKVRRLDPRSVNVREDNKVYVTAAGHSGVSEHYVPDAELIRFDSPTAGMLIEGARAIRIAALLQERSETLTDGTPPVDYFTPAEGADPADDDEIISILNDWKTSRQARETGYVPAALKYNTAGWNPEQLQLDKILTEAKLDIALYGGVDPEEVGVSTTSRTYNNAFDRRKNYTDFTLGLYRQAVEDRLSMGDITPRGYQAKLGLSAFLLSDDKTRYEGYKIGLEVGALDPEEIRPLENKPPIAKKAIDPPPTPAPAQQEQLMQASADAVTNVIFANFDDGQPLVFDILGSATEVDTEKRTITGLLVPYNVPGTSYGRTWVFSQGSLTFDDPSQVKLWIRHQPDTACGYLAAYDDRADGLYGTFQVDTSEDGTKALQKAKDKVNDGFSIGLHPNGLQPGGGKFYERDGVFYAVSMPLMETSLTPAPIFTNARVHAVAASATNTGEEMTKEQRDRLAALRAQKAANTAQFSADEQTEFDHLEALEKKNPVVPDAPAGPGAADFSAVGTAVTAAVTSALEAFGKREVIPAGGAGAQFSISEPAPYRFDGLRSENDFSTDLFKSLKFGDAEASQRLDEFFVAIAPQFAITGANVATLTPNKQRPDLYVDQKDFPTPVWDAIVKGGLTDGTPFVLPKFKAAGGLVADHVTMVEPASGTFETEAQTVTPKPQSGKVEIPREVWDLGGSPQLSGLLWNQINKAWFEGLEAYAVSILDAATPTQIVIPAGATDDVLASKISAELAKLQFVRGGLSMRDFFAQVDLFLALVDAVDAAGRPLFPMISPANANGTTDPMFAGVSVGGLKAKPAWALAASGAVPASSYLIDSKDVSGWASAPQRIVMDQLSVKSVQLGVWGYAAAAITDLTGVREVVYDPIA